MLFITLSSQISYSQNDTKVDSLLNELKKVQEDTCRVNTLNALSKHFIQISDYTKANNYAKDALLQAEKIHFSKGIAASYLNIGLIYTNQGDYPEALNQFRSSLKIYEDIGDKRGIADSYHMIGVIYYYQGNYSEALEKYTNSLKLNEEIGDKLKIANNYYSIGIIYSVQENYQEALKYFKASE